MEVNNKYYTPSIEEFHVGFEFEWKRDFEGDTKWKKAEYNPTMFFEYEEDSDVNMNSQVLLFLDRPEHQLINIRVKYLDKEDIESLGFKYDNNAEPIPSRRDWEIPKLEEFELPLAFLKDTQPKDGKCYFLYLYEDGTVWIDYIKNCAGMGYIFKGIIKNKSELKALLKQLGIDE